MKKITLCLMLYFIVQINCNSQIVYVNQNATGLNNGTSWQNAYRHLSNAINSTTNGQIWVAQGTYKPNTDINGQIPANARLYTFKLKMNVAIYGGFSGVETDLNQRNWENYPTIISGNIGDLDVIEDNVIHVFFCEYELLNSNTILDGLIITGGYASTEDAGTTKGGGIYVYQYPSGSFQLKNCIIEENYAEGAGGGLYMSNSNAIIDNCIFRNNVAFRGGGISMSTSSPIISNCEITNNFASYAFSYGEGGGIYLEGASRPKIFNSTLSNNYATYKGGAIHNSSNHELTFNNNIVSGNYSKDGGALFLDGKSYVFNNLFVDNTASRYGGAVFIDSGNGPFINNTVVNNTAHYGGGLFTNGSSPHITNSIFYNNSSSVGSQIYALNNVGNQGPVIRYSHVQGGLDGIVSNGNSIVYQDNIDGNPLYTAVLASNNYRLQELSLLIDAGTTSIFPTSWTGSNGEIINFPNTDLDGFQRIVGTIDLGAYEFGSTLGNHTSEKTLFTIYPNPSTGIFNISSNTNYDSLSVYNMQGIELFHKSSEPGMTSIDLTNYPSGFYYIDFLLNNKKYTYKIINK